MALAVTFFDSLTQSTGKQTIVDESFFLNHKITADKNAAPLFSLAKFQNDTRKKENLISLSGAIIDFDNTGDYTTAPDDVLHEISELEYYYYSTFSNTLEKPKWRLVIPFATDVTPSQYQLIVHDIMDLLGNPTGVDGSTFEPARVFYLPSIQSDEQMKFAGYNPGKRYAPDLFLIATNTQEPIQHTNLTHATHGRNNLLKAVVANCIENKKSFIATARRVHYIDTMQHATPLFSDNSEKLRGSTSELRAINFTASIIDAMPTKTKAALQWFSAAPQLPEPPQDYIINDDDINDAPGLVGMIARDILKQMIIRQAPLALASAISIVAALKSHSIAGDTGLRTNLYIVGLAKTGCGKQFGYDYAQKLFQELEIFKCISSEPRSANGIATALSMGESSSLCLWDEIGQDFRVMLSDNQSHFLAKISTELLKLFSQAGNVYQTGMLSDLERNQQKLFYQPCLNVLGMSVPEPFYESLTTSRIYDGLLPRILLFKTDFSTIKRNRKQPGRVKIAPSIVEVATKYARGMFINAKDLDVLFSKPKNAYGYPNEPRIVEMSGQIQPLLVNLECDIDKLRVGDDLITASIWTRAVEHIRKLSLVFCDDDVIDLQTFTFCKKLFTKLANGYVKDLRDNVRAPEDTRGVVRAAQKLLDSIPAGGLVGHSEMLKSSRLPAREFNEIIIQLLSAGQIERIESTQAEGPRRRRSYSYIKK